MMNILFVSLGCDKNLVDSEVMLGLLEKKGLYYETYVSQYGSRLEGGEADGSQLV